MKKFGYLLIFLAQQAFSQVSWNVDSVFIWRDENIPITNEDRTYNEVWGFVAGGREYGVIGSRTGTYILDVSIPWETKLVKYVPGAHNDATNRDYHNYNGYLYMVCDQGQSTLQILDLKGLPDKLDLVYDSDELFSNCHNIFIDSSTAHLYACDVRRDTIDIDLEIYDLSESYIPKKLLTYDNSNDAFHDIYVRNDTAFGNNGRTGMIIYDFTDMANPKILSGILDYPDKGFNHAGYTNTDMSYYYFTDETHGMDVKAVDVKNILNPSVVSLFNSGKHKYEIVAHNVLVRDKLVFVSYYHEGLQIFHIKDPAKPVKVGHYETYRRLIDQDTSLKSYKNYSGYRGAWGVYPFLPSHYVLVSDREKGLCIFDISKIDGFSHPDRPRDYVVPDKVLFPNPFVKEFEIAYNAENILSMELYYVNGKLIEKDIDFTGSAGMTKIILKSALNAGLYILRIRGRYETFTVKIEKR